MPRAEPVIVLAAGRGRRMGGPKAIMMVGGRPWWQWQSERLAAAGVSAVWVVSPEVRAAISGAGGQLSMGDGDPDAPMFETVRRGAEYVRVMRPPGVFVLPVDVPAAGANVWARLTAKGGVAAPIYGGEHGHPLYMEWGVVEEVLGAPEGARLDELIAGRVQYVGVDDASVVANLNVPEDVRAWEHGVARR